MSQSRKHSFIEALANTLVGIGLSLASVQWVFPLFGVEMSLSQNFASTGLMTVLSILRSYSLRRIFNWLHLRERT